MTVTAATSAAAGTNQRPPRADLAPSPCCARGLHSVRGHHTEPRKTCSRVRGFCNSAIMKREFVQPCAGQNSEFTSPPSPKKHVPVRQEQDKKKLEKKKKKKKKEERERERERERKKKKRRKKKKKKKKKKKREREREKKKKKHTESSKLNLNILNDQNQILTRWIIETKLFLKSQV